MSDWQYSMTRRDVLKSAVGAATLVASGQALADSPFAHANLITKPIPSSGEQLPVIGIGTSRTFDESNREQQLELLPVMETFFKNGGSLVDSSPMYGAAEKTLGVLLDAMGRPPGLFSATKVWTDGRESGVQQMEESLSLWGLESFDLMQIHNLRDWRVHLPTLREWKARGKIRYIGITTSHNRYHEELSEILKSETLDFVQFSYNIDNRVSEKTLLPIAQDRGIAVLVNRAFQRGSLFKKTRGKEIPSFARELGINSWGQFFLKFVVSHPAVTCVIPATSKNKHAVDNMQAGFGSLPDASARQQMISYFDSL